MKAGFLLVAVLAAQGGTDDFLTANLATARTEVARVRLTGKGGGATAIRGLHTEPSIHYKLRATWLTPEAIRAAANRAVN